MNGTNRKMNSEINVKEIFWRFLEQWKAVLLFSFIVALAFTSAKYIKDTKEYQGHNEQIVTVEENADVNGNIDAIMDSLGNEERLAVENLMKEKELLDVKEDYYNKSLVFHMNPGECRLLRLQYDVATEDERSKGTIIEAYENALMSEESVKSLAAVIDPELDAKYIYELFEPKAQIGVFNEIAAVDYSDSLVVNVLLPEKTDSDEIETALNGIMDNLNSLLSGRVGKHDISLISSDTIRFCDTDLALYQTEFMSKLNESRTNYNKNYALLSDQQRTAYNKMMSLETGDGGEFPVAESNKPKISIKAFLTGIILGAFIYGVVLGLFLIIRRRVISKADTNYYPGVRTIYCFINNKKKTGLFQSKSVEKIRNRNPLTHEDQVKACWDVISLICAKEKLDDITILSPGSLEKDCNQLVTEICGNLNQHGLNTSIKEVGNFGFEINERELIESPHIIPVIVEDKTTLDGFNALMNMCAYYKIDVIGTIYYGER